MVHEWMARNTTKVGQRNQSVLQKLRRRDFLGPEDDKIATGDQSAGPLAVCATARPLRSSAALIAFVLLLRHDSPTRSFSSTSTSTSLAMTTDPRFTPVLLTLPSFTPSLALEVLPHGVTFHRLYVQADGKVRLPYRPL